MVNKNKKIEAKEEASQETGKTLISWKAEEFVQAERSGSWYWVGGIIALALVVLAVLFQQWLLAVIVILLALIIFQLSRAKPAVVETKITEKGIVYREKFYPFADFKSFGIVENQNRLEVDATKAFGRSLSLPLDEADQERITTLLEQHLEKVEKKETFIDKFSKTLKV